MKYFDIPSAPFELSGLAEAHDNTFYRLPVEIHDKVNEGVTGLAKHTAGACVRFVTDSASVAIKATLLNKGVMSHMPLSGQSGIDVYFDGLFVTTVRTGSPEELNFEGTVTRPSVLEEGVHKVELFLPLYNGITALAVGVNDDATVDAPPARAIAKPVAFYGSSITQGGCASKPGNSYNAMLARWLDFSQVNLGFSGSGKGEQIVADYIASLDLAAFVLDYDHNAPDAEYLKKTHKPFFDTIRAAHPELPIIIMTKPDFDSDPVGNSARREVVRATYEAAIAAGDKNVYFIDGESFFDCDMPNVDRRACTVDGCHPNDLGFYRMASRIYPVLKEALGV